MSDMSDALRLDGNSVGGLLDEVFGREMTNSPCQCAYCGAVGPIATLMAFIHAPGVVLRCPRCEEIGLRLVTMPEAFHLDVRGAVYLQLARSLKTVKE